MLTTAMAVVAVLPANDMARARKFYEGVLGLSPDDMLPAGDDSVLYTVNGHSFMVYRTDAPRGGATQASFLVKDVAAEIKELEARGVKFEDYDLPGLKTVNHVVETPGMKGAWFKDSEGNIWALTERA